MKTETICYLDIFLEVVCILKWKIGHLFAHEFLLRSILRVKNMCFVVLGHINTILRHQIRFSIFLDTTFLSPTIWALQFMFSLTFYENPILCPKNTLYYSNSEKGSHFVTFVAKYGHLRVKIPYKNTRWQLKNSFNILRYIF